MKKTTENGLILSPKPSKSGEEADMHFYFPFPRREA
jgi:hypothetical protein